MKKIEATLRPTGFGELEKTLRTVGYPGIVPATTGEYEKTKSISWQWGELNFKVEFLPVLKLEIWGPDLFVDRIAKANSQRPRTAA